MMTEATINYYYNNKINLLSASKIRPQNNNCNNSNDLLTITGINFSDECKYS